MINKRELFEKYSNQDFIGYSVRFSKDTEPNIFVTDDEPWELYFNKKEYNFDLKEYCACRGNKDNGTKLIFGVIKDVTDASSPDESKNFDPASRVCCSDCKFFVEENCCCNNVKSHSFTFRVDPNSGCRHGKSGVHRNSIEIRYNADDARAVEFAKGFDNAKPF